MKLQKKGPGQSVAKRPALSRRLRHRRFKSPIPVEVRRKAVQLVTQEGLPYKLVAAEVQGGKKGRISTMGQKGSYFDNRHY